eukprot:57679_1
MFASLFVMINTICWLSSLSQAGVACRNASECVGNTIIDDSGTVYGYGYKSMSGGNTSINNYQTACFGAFSCDGISFINSSSNVYCMGSNSCRNVYGSNLSFIGGALIQCYGTNSCSYSNMRATGANGFIGCGGDQSCVYSHIEDTSDISATGSYSLLYAVIKSANNNTTMNVDLFGFNAGFGANIICELSDVCYINCHGNGCYMTYINCIGQCIITNTSNSTIPPITNINMLGATTLSLLYDSESITINNDQQCNQHPNSIAYDNHRQHYGGSDVFVNGSNPGSLCCRGSYSCYGVSNINTITATICGGEYGCEYASINNNKSPIFCEGFKSCRESHIITTNDVYCLGQGSCTMADITAAQNVYCSGQKACKTTVINSAGDLNLYLLGKLAADNLVLNCNEPDVCSVFCGGQISCSTATFIGNISIIREFGSNITYQPTESPTNKPIATKSPTNKPTESPITSGPTNNPNFICYDEDIGFVNTTYKLSATECIEDMQNTISIFVNDIDVVYYKYHFIVKSYITEEDGIKLETYANRGDCIDNVTVHVITCFDETINVNKLLNVTNSTEFIDDVNERTYNNDTTIVIVNIAPPVYFNDDENNIKLWIIIGSSTFIFCIIITFIIVYYKKKRGQERA